MSCFDRVWLPCPQCGVDVEIQSKAGECNMDEFRAHEVPMGIAASIQGEAVTCHRCKSSLKVEAQAPSTVFCRLLRVSDTPESDS